MTHKCQTKRSSKSIQGLQYFWLLINKQQYAMLYSLKNEWVLNQSRTKEMNHHHFYTDYTALQYLNWNFSMCIKWARLQILVHTLVGLLLNLTDGFSRVRNNFRDLSRLFGEFGVINTIMFASLCVFFIIVSKTFYIALITNF